MQNEEGAGQQGVMCVSCCYRLVVETEVVNWDTR